MLYNEANDTLGKRESRKVGNNTYLHRIDSHSIGLRLHNTDVVTWYDDGRIVLNSNGYTTATTKDRMNTYAPVLIFQKAFVWYFHIENFFGLPVRSTTYEYRDGVTIYHNGDTDAKVI